MLVAGGCALPGGPASGPDGLAEAAARVPEGPRRASIHLVDRACAALEHSDVESARALLARSLRLDGRNPYAYNALARVHLLLRDPAPAARDIDQAEALLLAGDPDNERWQGKLLRLRAELSWLQHDTRGASALRARADALDPGGSMPGSPPSHLLETPR